MAIVPTDPGSVVIGSVGSLFTGIGGMDRGLELAGWHVIWQSEIKPSAVAVLTKHWPTIPNLGDITTIEWSRVERPALLCGGFPCPDISDAHTNGKRLGLAGAQSGLWSYFAAAINALEPPWVLIENVAAWQRWVPDVRADLAGLGYASVSMALSAGSFGAPHKRPRCFVVAHADSDGEPLRSIHAEASCLRPLSGPDSRDWRDAPSRSVRLDDGVPRRVGNDLYGNAVVPAVAEWLGAQIKAVA